MNLRRLSRLVGIGLALLALLAGAAGLELPAYAAASIPSGHGYAISPFAKSGAPYQRVANAIPQVTQFSCQVNFGCYDPDQIHQAYGIQPLLNAGYNGAGHTVVIVDAYSNATIVRDLKLFDQVFGLPDPVFQIVDLGVPPFNYNDANQVGWSGEIALDVEWSHAVAPGAKIVLVEAKSNDDADILAALKYAVDNNLGDVISQSFGEGESCVDPVLDAKYHQVYRDATYKRITLYASTGDQGSAQPTCDGADGSYFKSASSPAVDQFVSAVGGTRLNADVNGNYVSEQVWNESSTFDSAGGGGFSTMVRKASYQYGVSGIGAWRGIPDVSYNAAIIGGVLTVWDSDGTGPGVYRFGGTSAGSPQWAGLTAIANQMSGRRAGFTNRAFYNIGKTPSLYAADFHDITVGDNAYNPVDYPSVHISGYSAGTGWDAASGWGTPKANSLLPVVNNYTKYGFYDFNVLALNGFDTTGGGGNIAGRVGVGGNATFNSTTIGYGLSTEYNLKDELVVGGNLSFNNGNVGGGNVVVGGSASIPSYATTNGSVSQHVSAPFGVADTNQFVSNLSDAWAAIPSNGTTTVRSWGTIELNGSNAYRNVFTVNASDLSKANNLQISAPAGSDVVVNVNGTPGALQNMGISLNGVSSNRVVYNFYNATKLTLNGVSVPGLLFAPNADAYLMSGNLQGTIVAKNIHFGSFSVQSVPFRGDLA